MATQTWLEVPGLRDYLVDRNSPQDWELCEWNAVRHVRGISTVPTAAAPEVSVGRSPVPAVPGFFSSLICLEHPRLLCDLATAASVQSVNCATRSNQIASRKFLISIRAHRTESAQPVEITLTRSVMPIVLLGACEEAADTFAPRQASACLGLSQPDCAAGQDCAWDAGQEVRPNPPCQCTAAF